MGDHTAYVLKERQMEKKIYRKEKCDGKEKADRIQEHREKL